MGMILEKMIVCMRSSDIFMVPKLVHQPLQWTKNSLFDLVLDSSSGNLDPNTNKSLPLD